MSMGIGGAETHIYELSLELLKRGHDVTIISAGGEFMPKLIEKGIKHIFAPMNVRSVRDIFSSYKILCRAIKKERPDIIHAHARIPALVSHYASKKFNIPFVTTDHGKFDTALLTRLMTRWGDKTLAVSEDLKEYLLENYNVKEKNVFLTINGIDTDEFSPEKKRSVNILNEFSIPNDSKVILTVSRLDSTAFMCAEELVRNAKAIYQKNPQTRILIVGHGNMYDTLKVSAQKINSELGLNYIIMPGQRTDISEICSVCSVFCGVSRAAMEAAASGKPILIAGGKGYFGQLNQGNIDLAKSYNFTCRGINSFDDDKFVGDILEALTPTETSISNVTFLRNYIIQNLSAKRMTDDTENVYFDAMRSKGKYDCVLLGYYGFGNMGDDALLMSVIKNLRSKIPYLRIAVMSYDVKKMKANLNHLSVFVFNRFNVLSTLKVFRNSKYLIFGGGTLLQDNTSTKSLLYYLYMVRLAKRYGLDVILYANGIGPIRKEKNKRRIKSILPKISLITARDKQTYDYIKNLDNNVNIHLTADEALTIAPQSSEKVILSEEFIKKGFVCFSVRKWRDIKDEEYIKYARVVSDFCQRNGFCVLLIVMEAHNDLAITEKIANYFKTNVKILYAGGGMNGEELTGIISNAKMTISVRLHSLIFSACAGVPMIGLSYDPKVSSFMKLAGIDEKYIVDIGLNSANDLKNAINALYEELDTEKKRLKSAMEILKQSAEENAKTTAEYILESKTKGNK